MRSRMNSSLSSEVVNYEAKLALILKRLFRISFAMAFVFVI